MKNQFFKLFELTKTRKKIGEIRDLANGEDEERDEVWEYLNSRLIESVWGFSLMSLSRDSIIRKKGFFY